MLHSTVSFVSYVCVCIVLLPRCHHGIHERTAKCIGHGETPPAACARTGSPGSESQRIVLVLVLVLILILLILVVLVLIIILIRDD